MYLITTASSYGLRASDLRILETYDDVLDYIIAWKVKHNRNYYGSWRIYKIENFGDKPKNVKWPTVKKDLDKPRHIRKWDKRLNG